MREALKPSKAIRDQVEGNGKKGCPFAVSVHCPKLRHLWTELLFGACGPKEW